jgi:hypothetical protein
VGRGAAKNRGKPFWASCDERMDCEAGSSIDLPLTYLHLPCAHPHSGWVLIKAALEGASAK